MALRTPILSATALLVASSAALAGTLESGAASSLTLYRAGRVVEARAAYAHELAAVEAGGDRAALYAQLLYIAWLEESLGAPKPALAAANRALALAVELGDPFRIGRSLCFAGWSLASLGRYHAALELFDEAIAIGAPEGRIQQVAVWGLATQEKGWVLARLGRLAEARALIETTTDFARRHGIDTGVAEGGVHLARIALLEGALERARSLADEALRASLRCDCRDANTARAHVAVAQVALARARVDPRFAGDAVEAAQTAQAYADRIGDARHLAESKLLLSRALPAQPIERRLALARSAVELLTRAGSEVRGRAEVQLGRVLASGEQAELARFYVESGFEIEESLLRQVDAAYALTDLAMLTANEPDRPDLAARADAATRAAAAGALPLALDNQEALSRELFALGFTLHARAWTEDALDTIARLAERAEDEALRRELLARELALEDRLAEIALRLSPALLPSPAGR